MVMMPHWPNWNIRSNQKKSGLERMEEIMAALGAPHLRLPPIIHVTGTNGKGSSVSYFKSIFQHAGYKVHVYTSPHLIEFNERIVIANEQISDQELFRLLETVRLKAEEYHIEDMIFFEAITAAAILGFAECSADVLLLEVGIGGRLDATNIVPENLLSLITTISLDHVDYLGPTLRHIAREKAGIIKNNSYVLIGPQVEEVYLELFQYCDSVGVECFAFQYDFGIELLNEDILIVDRENKIAISKPALLGEHQILNAAVVAYGAQLLSKTFSAITEKCIRNGIANAFWPGRLQKVPYFKYKNITHKGIEIYLDGAHNDGGAKVIAEFIKNNHSSGYQNVYIILGMTQKRNPASFISYFYGLYKNIYCVKVLSEASGYSAKTLDNLLRGNGISSKAVDSIEDALVDISLNNADATVYITGSLFLVADFLKLKV